MGRARLIRTSQFPYHIVSRSNNKEWFCLPLKDVWQICLRGLKYAQDIAQSDVLAFVLMSNHYHLIIKTPYENIDKFMYTLNKFISHNIRLKSDRINHIFGGRYRWSIIKNEAYYYQALKYVYLNPVRANVVLKAEEYPYSTLHYFCNKKKLDFEINTEHLKRADFLSWVNEGLTEDQTLSLKNGLRKKELKHIKERASRKPIKL